MDDAIGSELHQRFRQVSGAGYVHPAGMDHNPHVTSGSLSNEEYARLMRKYHQDFPEW